MQFTVFLYSLVSSLGGAQSLLFRVVTISSQYDYSTRALPVNMCDFKSEARNRKTRFKSRLLSGYASVAQTLSLIYLYCYKVYLRHLSVWRYAMSRWRATILI